MALIAWGPWQIQHITRRHGVTAHDFDLAWHDPQRWDLGEEHHEKHGPYYLSVGASALGKVLKMVWRWQRRGEVVWPITAFFPTPRRGAAKKKR